MKQESKKMNKQNPTSNNKGITLIALVITIIVMLILVAVTINLAINGGLFNYARDAATRTQEEIDKEKNLSIDDLVEEYVGGDLKKLREYFIGKTFSDVYDASTNKFYDLDPILDASTSIFSPYYIDNLEDMASIIGNIGFWSIEHNSHYFLVYIDNNTNKFNNVVEVNGKEEFVIRMEFAINKGEGLANEFGALLYNNKLYTAAENQDTVFGVEYIEVNIDADEELCTTIINSGTFKGNIGPVFFEYNNKIYQIFTFQSLDGETTTQRGIILGNNSSAFVFEGGKYLEITDTNQTWTSWANSEDNNDIEISNTTLKQMILNNETYPILVKATSYERVDYNENIMPGCLYIMDRGNF